MSDIVNNTDNCSPSICSCNKAGYTEESKGMIAVQVDTPDEFLAQSLKFRSVNPFMTNLIGSVALTYSRKEHDEKCFWWLVKSWQCDGDGDVDRVVVGIAMRTGFRPLIASPMSVHAAEVLGAAMAVVDKELPGVNGVDGSAEMLAECYRLNNSNYQDLKSIINHKLFVYALRRDVTEFSVSGRAQKVLLDDCADAIQLMEDFHRECNLDFNFDMARFVRNKLEDGLLYYWLNEEGVVVGFGGHSARVESVSGGVLARVGPMYVIPEQRNKGYASALTTHMCKLLQDEGVAVMLFADVDNPSSNKVYTKLGFEKIGLTLEYVFK